MTKCLYSVTSPVPPMALTSLLIKPGWKRKRFCSQGKVRAVNPGVFSGGGVRGRSRWVLRRGAQLTVAQEKRSQTGESRRANQSHRPSDGSFYEHFEILWRKSFFFLYLFTHAIDGSAVSAPAKKKKRKKKENIWVALKAGQDSWPERSKWALEGLHIAPASRMEEGVCELWPTKWVAEDFWE